jgi:hypothetical protein
MDSLGCSGSPDKAEAVEAAVSWLIAVTLILMLLCGTGCFTRTVYVPAGKSVMLREELRGVKVWAKDSKGVMVPGEFTLREGWFVLPCDEPDMPVIMNVDVPPIKESEIK